MMDFTDFIKPYVSNLYSYVISIMHHLKTVDPV